ncbi:hypothetical protein QVD99_002278 [Batrachochytrium dendrobatidis]|nr:hypothetical protein QVD99_002278 [Batrachochytrium dendrobatidis]
MLPFHQQQIRHYQQVKKQDSKPLLFSAPEPSNFPLPKHEGSSNHDDYKTGRKNIEHVGSSNNNPATHPQQLFQKQIKRRIHNVQPNPIAVFSKGIDDTTHSSTDSMSDVSTDSSSESSDDEGVDLESEPMTNANNTHQSLDPKNISFGQIQNESHKASPVLDLALEAPQLDESEAIDDILSFDSDESYQSAANESYSSNDSLDISRLPQLPPDFDCKAVKIPDEHVILSDYLLLEKPTMNDYVRNYLHTRDGFKNLVAFLTLPGTTDPPMFLENDDGDITKDVLLEPRHQSTANWTRDEAQRGWAVANILADSSLLTNSSDAKGDKACIIRALVRICEPQARGNFKHLSKAFLGFGREQSDILAIATLKVAHQRPLLLQLLRCVVQPEVTDCLMLLMRWGPPEKPTMRKQLFEHLFHIQLADSILDLVCFKEQPQIAIAASELFVRLYRQCLNIEHSNRMYMTIGGEGKRISRLLDNIVELLHLNLSDKASFESNDLLPNHCHSKMLSAWLDVIDCIVVPRKQSIVQTKIIGAILDVPVSPEPRNSVIKTVRKRFPRLCSDMILTSAMPVVSTLLKLLDIIQGVVTNYKDSEDLDQICKYIPWKKLTDWFFGRFKENNIYHTCYYKLVYHIIHQHHSPSLDTLFYNDSILFLNRLLANYNTLSANRGYIRVILNIIRLHIQKYPLLQPQASASTNFIGLTSLSHPTERNVYNIEDTFGLVSFNNTSGYFAVLTKSHQDWNEILPKLVFDTLSSIRRLGKPSASVLLPQPLANPISTAPGMWSSTPNSPEQTPMHIDTITSMRNDHSNNLELTLPMLTPSSKTFLGGSHWAMKTAMLLNGPSMPASGSSTDSSFLRFSTPIQKTDCPLLKNGRQSTDAFQPNLVEPSSHDQPSRNTDDDTDSDCTISGSTDSMELEFDYDCGGVELGSPCKTFDLYALQII